MKKTILATLVLFLFINVSAQNSCKDLNSIVNKYTIDSLFNGTIIIAKKNKILFQGSFGLKNIETKEKITSSTLFPIASLTKQFTSTAILLLDENNRLSINDKISDYIEVPESMKNIKIINLMNHTSGIPDYWQFDISNQKDSIYMFINQQDSLEFITNTKHEYCNSGYFLLGEIIESVSGKSYSDFLRDNIFIPLGMENTFIDKTPIFNRAIGYDENWKQNDYLINTADGGIISTLENLYLWDKALFENKILTIESKELMFKPLTLYSGETINYGFGWDINDNNKNIVSHTGWLSSFGAYNQIDNENGYFIILLSNQIRPELMDLINDINGELYKIDE